MATNISYGIAFNPLNVFVPGIYLQVIPPQAVFGGIPTTVGATVGTGSWGQVGGVSLVGSNSQINAAIGPIGPQALNDIHDLATSSTIALAQGVGISGLALYITRASDGTDTAATINLKDSTGATYAVVNAAQTGVLGGAITPTLSAGASGPDQTITFTGTTTTGDVVNLIFANSLLPAGRVVLSYTLVSGDTTLTILAGHITTAINANTVLGATGFTATSNGAVITVSWGTNLASVTITTIINGTTTATIGGTATPTDTVTINVVDASLPGGSVAIPYVVQNADTATLIATGLKNAINASAPLIAIGVTATSSAAVLSLKSTSPTLTTYTSALSTGATETVTFAAGPTEIATSARLPAINVVVNPFSGGGAPEQFNGLSGNPNRFPAALQSAINNGLNAARGKSNFITIPSITPTTNAIALGSFTLVGGSDGRNVSTSQLVGNPGASPPTGLFAIQNQQFTPSVAWVTGLTDPNGYALVQNYATTFNVFTLLTFASGQTTAQAVTTKSTTGIANYNVGFVKDWLSFLDTANGVTRLVDPTPFAAGTIASLNPWVSPLNKSVQLVTGSERNGVPYSNSELSQLGQAGIMLITNPIGKGAVWGFQNGYNSVGNNDITSYVEYSRMTNFLVATNAANLGLYLGENTTFNSTDSARALIQGSLTAFLAALQAIPAIGAFSVECDTGNNPASQLALHEVQINETVQFLPSIQTIFGQVQGGTTVQIGQNNASTSIQFN